MISLEFGFEELNNLTHNSDYYLPCSINGLSTTLHKYRFNMYINGSAALAAFPDAKSFNSWRSHPVVLSEGRELKLPQISLEFNDCSLFAQNLADYNLAAARFKNVNMQQINLENANLAGAFFEEVDFSDANLSGAKISAYSRFEKCCFKNANLTAAGFDELIWHADQNLSRYSRTHFKLSKCEMLPGLSITLPSKLKRQESIEKMLKKIIALLKPIDQTGVFCCTAAAFRYDRCFDADDPYTIFLQEFKNTYPDWYGLAELEELLAEISAVLVFDKLRF